MKEERFVTIRLVDVLRDLADGIESGRYGVTHWYQATHQSVESLETRSYELALHVLPADMRQPSP